MFTATILNIRNRDSCNQYLYCLQIDRITDKAPLSKQITISIIIIKHLYSVCIIPPCQKKVDKCRDKSATANSNISKVSEKHKIDDIKTNRSLFIYYNRPKGSEKELYLSLNNTNLETIKTTIKLYV